MEVGLPLVCVRVAEGRCGSTLLMQLLATSPAIVFDDRYPAEYRFASYFARVAEMMTEPFDEARHPGATPFFFRDSPVWGPVPFGSDVVDVAALRPAMLRSMWTAWSDAASAERPHARYYAEKIAVPLEVLTGAGLACRVIDLVRDPRDMLASIRSFSERTAGGFGRRPGQAEHEYVVEFIDRIGSTLSQMATAPSGLHVSWSATRTSSAISSQSLPGLATGSASNWTPTPSRLNATTISIT